MKLKKISNETLVNTLIKSIDSTCSVNKLNPGNGSILIEGRYSKINIHKLENTPSYESYVNSNSINVKCSELTLIRI